MTPIENADAPRGNPASAATPATQKAIVQIGMGGPEVLHYVSIPVLEPGEGQVLIRVVAASVNPGDWKFRTGIIFKEAGLKGPGVSGAPPPDASSDKVPGGDLAGHRKARPGRRRFHGGRTGARRAESHGRICKGAEWRLLTVCRRVGRQCCGKTSHIDLRRSGRAWQGRHHGRSVGFRGRRE